MSRVRGPSWVWPPARAALVALAVLVLVFAVAVGSSRSLAHARGGPVLTAPAVINDLFLAFALLAVLVLAGLVYTLWGGRKRDDDELEPVPEQLPLPWWQKLLALMLALLPAAGLVAGFVLAVRHRGPPARPRRVAPGVTGPHPAGHPGSRLPSAAVGSAPVHWWFWASLAAVAAAAVLVLMVRRRREAGGTGARRGAPRPLTVMIEESLAEIERESDPRRAVIRAYAGMERALARHGLGRHPSEAPQEYLARALGVIRVSGPAGERLTGLFQRARFSEHPVGGQMKGEAIAALAAIRDELAEPAR